MNYKVTNANIVIMLLAIAFFLGYISNDGGLREYQNSISRARVT